MKIIIAGGGQVGCYLANILLEKEHDVKVVEQREAVLKKLRNELPENAIVAGNASDPAVLESIAIEKCEVLVAVTGADETNLVVSTMAKMEYGVPNVVARVNNPKNDWLFTPSMGVDVAINQANILARIVEEEMILGDMITLLKLRTGNYSLIEKVVSVHSEVINKSLKDITFPEKCSIVAIMRDNELIVPNGDTVLFSDDRVIVICEKANIDRLSDMLNGK